MIVYVTFEKDGYDGTQIEMIFDNKKTAQNHVFETRFKNNEYYAGRSPHELEELALDQIESIEVFQN